MHAHVSGCLILGFPIAGFPIVVNFTTCMVHVKECEDHRSSQTEIIPNISMISSCTKAYKLQKFHKIHNNGVILLTNKLRQKHDFINRAELSETRHKPHIQQPSLSSIDIQQMYHMSSTDVTLGGPLSTECGSYHV